MDELTPEQQFATEPTLADIYRALLKGEPREEIIARLLRYDYSEVGARAHVARAEDDIRRFRASPESRAALLRDASNQMMGGCLIGFLGAAVFALSIIGFLVTGSLHLMIPIAGVVAGLIGCIFMNRGWTRRALFREIEAASGRRDDSGPSRGPLAWNHHL